MAEIGNRYVKQGYWVNIEGGGTITTDIQTGTVVVALLALLSSLGVSHLWNLVTFACHQIRANGRRADGLYWQQQALLRAQLPPTAFLADWIKLWWVWRNKAKKAHTRSIIHIPLGVLFMASIIAVGIFSSFIVDSTNLQVLANNPDCGYLNLTAIGDGIGYYKRDIYARSDSYADDCYVNSTSLPARCSIFLRPNLALNPEPAECPFDRDMCVDHDGTLGVTIDSGLVNANEIIGWNLNHRDQVKFRRKVTCGVIKTREYSQVINASLYPFPSRRKFMPGEQVLVSRYYNNDDPSIWENVTFVHSLLEANVSDTYTFGTTLIYLSPERNVPVDIVIPELAFDKGDLALTQIRSNNVRYLSPVNDPLFAAHRPVNITTVRTNVNVTQYYSDWPGNTIGCIQQYQYCILRDGKPDLCSELTGLPAEIPHEQLPGATDTQLVALQLILDANSLFDTSDASRSLRAAKMLDSGYLSPLPDDQWIQEVVGWESMLWASFQNTLSDFGNGYGLRDREVRNYIKKPSRVGERVLCGAQRMRKSGGFMNINVFGLAFVTTFSCVVTLIDLIILKFAIFLQSFRKLTNPRIDRWVQDGVFQLQRRAFESQGQGGEWIREEKEVPATARATEIEELPNRLGARAGVGVCRCCGGAGGAGDGGGGSSVGGMGIVAGTTFSSTLSSASTVKVEAPTKLAEVRAAEKMVENPR